MKIDKNKNGQITANELQEYFEENKDSLAMQHQSINKKMILDFMEQIDQNKNSSIDYREFIAATVRRKLFGDAHSAKKNFNLIVQSFNFFDLDENGLISKDEMALILRKENPDISDEIIEFMMQEVDTNNDGVCSFEEFINMMRVKFEEEEQQSEVYREY